MLFCLCFFLFRRQDIINAYHREVKYQMLHLSWSWYDKYARIRSIRCCDVFVFVFDLSWQIHITDMIKLIKINSTRCCDLLSLSRYELLYNIYFDAAHQYQKYRKLWRLCIFICVDMTNTPNTFRPSSSRSKVWDVWTSLYFSLSWHDKYTKYISIKLIKIKSIRCCDVRVSRAHCWNSEGKLLSTNTNAADHSLLFFPQDLNTF